MNRSLFCKFKPVNPPGKIFIVILGLLVATSWYSLLELFLINRGAVVIENYLMEEIGLTSFDFAITQPFQVVLENNPNNCQALRLLGFGLARKGQYLLGQKYLEKAVNICETDGASRLGLANVYYTLGQYDLAIEQWRMAKAAPGFLMQCRHLMDGKKYIDAIQVCGVTVDSEPEKKEGYILLGEAFLVTKKYREALVAFDRAVKLEPNDYSAHLGLGKALWGLYEDEKALNEWDKAVSLASYPEEIYLTIGDSYRLREDFESATTWYWRAVKSNSSNYSSWLNLGVVSYLQEDCDNAILYLENAIDLKPDKVYAHAYLGRCLYVINKSSVAISHLEFSVEVWPSNAGYRAWLGDAYLALGMENEAKEQYIAALLLEPTNKDLQTRINNLNGD